MKQTVLNTNRLILSLLAFISVRILAQSVETLYVKMPDILNPTLSSQNRLELLEYHKAHQTDTILNRFGNKVSLILLDTVNQHLIVQNTPTSTFEMKLNRLSDSVTYIGIIRTVCAPVCHSSIEFYDTAWHKIPLFFKMPKAGDWIQAVKDSDQTELNRIHKMMDIDFVSLSFANENNTLIAKNNTTELLSTEDKKSTEALLSDRKFRFKLKNRTWCAEKTH